MTPTIIIILNFIFNFTMTKKQNPKNLIIEKKFNQEIELAIQLRDRISEGEKLKILGMQAFANRLPMKEKECYQQLVDAYPNDERAHLLLGNHYFFQAEYNKAIGSYRRSVSLHSSTTLTYWRYSTQAKPTESSTT